MTTLRRLPHSKTLLALLQINPPPSRLVASHLCSQTIPADAECSHFITTPEAATRSKHLAHQPNIKTFTHVPRFALLRQEKYLRIKSSLLPLRKTLPQSVNQLSLKLFEIVLVFHKRGSLAWQGQGERARRASSRAVERWIATGRRSSGQPLLDGPPSFHWTANMVPHVCLPQISS